jgi:hypothetical protein
MNMDSIIFPCNIAKKTIIFVIEHQKQNPHKTYQPSSSLLPNLWQPMFDVLSDIEV